MSAKHTLKCKVGDLAMIVRADNDPGCVGRVVRVVALRIAMGGPAWQVDPPVFWRDDVTGLDFEVMWDDRDLRPLPGDTSQGPAAQVNPAHQAQANAEAAAAMARQAAIAEVTGEGA